MQIQGTGLAAVRMFQDNGLKSTREKLQRQTACENKVAFLENQKNNLKNMEGDSLEEIGRKLELFHDYEDQIAQAKAEYNDSQMLHVMDEARERAEQIAKAAEKYAQKTPEERREELLKEALGTDETEGALTESMEALSKLAEELTDQRLEDIAGALAETADTDITMDENEPAETTADADINEMGYPRVDVRI